MTGSLFFKIAIGLFIFLAAITYQFGKLKKLAPSLDDFKKTTDISGAYSYQKFGKNYETQVDGKYIYCGVNYSGGVGSCIAHLKEVPPNSQVTVTVASIKTNGGDVLCASSIKFEGREIYRKSPEKIFSDWWFTSRLHVTIIPMLLVAIYLVIIFVFFTQRG
ncbi:hypothetical protein ISP15_16605 [Dyella jejuensis]|uniref:DUF3592 domain-containing protein n=1 Tax=Dyella jejuensis TaxID=1432009 RepID=A0ABW8JLI0_9GAMM